MQQQYSSPHFVALFSGGLDSILAAKLIQEQGLAVSCLHFYSPFFGNPALIPRWEKQYGLSIRAIDIAEPYVSMMVNRPKYGFGSVLNPCVDCKILMLRHAHALMIAEGASGIISGEVLGQRPMSQRRDTLYAIRRDADVADVLVRPLCALHFEPTRPERDGIIDRSRLLGFSGRGRQPQRDLAKQLGLKNVPNAAGGCRLTEQENARAYWPVLRYIQNVSAADFYLANAGRQYWSADGSKHWLIIGRNQADNDMLMQRAGPNDLIMKLSRFTGPLALLRYTGQEHSNESIASAAAFMASYSPKAKKYVDETGHTVAVRIHKGHLDNPGYEIRITPQRDEGCGWKEPMWDIAQAAIKDEARQQALAQSAKRDIS